MSKDAGGLLDPPVIAVERLSLKRVQKPWRWADDHRTEIGRYFEELKRARPSVWNGRVLMLHDKTIAGDLFSGAFFETDFASLDAWRRWNRPDPSVGDCFAAVALFAADGGCLLGEMAADTANAGLIYFPAGTPDPVDVVDGVLDFEASAWRELEEETGIMRRTLAAERGWTVINEKSRTALIKAAWADEPADRLRARILDNLAGEAQPELSDIHVIRGPDDLNDRMPLFVAAYLQHRWSHAEP
ncbi:MAG: NUDIX hydrolase [Pseudolabrys sp.]